jgi:hypothetical protein
VRDLLRERGLRAVEPDGGQAMQADGLDQRADVRLGAAQPQGPALGTQPLRQAGQIDHHRGVGEVELGEVDDDVTGRLQRRGQGAPAASTGRAVFVPRDPQDRKLLVKVNDPGKLIHTLRFVQGLDK